MSRTPLDPPAFVRPAEDRAARIKRLHAAIEAGDKDILRKAKELGAELIEERQACVKERRGWLAHLKVLGIPQPRAHEYMDIAKAYQEGGLLSDSDNLGYSESLIRIRAARKPQEEDSETSPPPDPEPDAPPRRWITLEEWNELDQAERRAAFKEARDNDSHSVFNDQGKNDNIEWALWSWNPVTGCLHNCPYCYARDIAERFYDQKFAPSLWPGRLHAPRNTPFPADRIKAEAEPWRKRGLGNVFVCSMADLFGRWVPQEWIDAVLAEVRKAPRWTFLFLTKFPIRMAEFDFPDNAWVGTTVDCQARVANAEKSFRKVKARVKWLSCEPLIESLKFQDIGAFSWVILGGASRSAQTPEWSPPRHWITEIECEAKRAGVQVYEKSNLKLARIREYPGESVEPLEAPAELRYLPTPEATP